MTQSRLMRGRSRIKTTECLLFVPTLQCRCSRTRRAAGKRARGHASGGDEQPADEHDQSNKQVASYRVNVEFKLLIDHVSALEYAAECATSEAYNTIFTAQASSAAPQALQAATTAVQLREALLAAMPLPCASSTSPTP